MSAFTAYRGAVLTDNIEDYPEGIILPIDKPYRWTSADVIRKVKWMAIKHFHKKNLKVGHAGTLDPLATGVLLVCIGKATKLADELQKSPKQYIAGVAFGATTPSYDREKEIDATYPLDRVSQKSIEELLPRFIGEQDQIAPLFSAKSVDGMRAYEMARKLYKAGKPVDSSVLQSSRISIYDLKLLDYHLSDSSAGMDTASPTDGASGRINVNSIEGHTLAIADILVDCSKGTYIRALARDLGEALGSGAFLSSLRRTRNGGIRVEDALTMDDIAGILRPDR
ncbi:MAG: tRNA pseudouridine(55) synthase TruB [Bacteroidales bacterium]|nr:tRNA pseudouridine(55) synthase TruB [Bacteroidales bacterium]